jgi:hypothetical protein
MARFCETKYLKEDDISNSKIKAKSLPGGGHGAYQKVFLERRMMLIQWHLPFREKFHALFHICNIQELWVAEMSARRRRVSFRTWLDPNL